MACHSGLQRSLHLHLFLLLLGASLFVVLSSGSSTEIQPKVALFDAFPKLRFSSATGLLANPSKDDDLLYVVQLEGVVLCFPNKASTKPSDVKVFLNITDRVVSNVGEMGLLGFAFHPNFPDTPYFYINYNRENGSAKYTYISRFTADSRKSADPSSELVLLKISQPFLTQKGGPLLFDKTGNLLIALGDGGSTGDPHGNGQNMNSLLGKILRINVDLLPGQTAHYTIPSDNPFVNQTGVRKEIYSLGLRNPWRCSYDSKDDNIWCADVGESRWEEVDIIKKGGNYGWNVAEGPTCFSDTNCDFGSFTPPVYWYPHPSLNLPTLFSGVALIGGYVYRGKGIPALRGQYVFADFIVPKIGSLVNDDGVWRDNLVIPDVGKLMIIGFGEDTSKELYVLSYGDDQAIHRLRLASCGNGKVDTDEECDYGDDKTSRHWSKRCCNSQTCQFLEKDSSCGNGGVCSSNGRCKN